MTAPFELKIVKEIQVEGLWINRSMNWFSYIFMDVLKIDTWKEKYSGTTSLALSVAVKLWNNEYQIRVMDTAKKQSRKSQQSGILGLELRQNIVYIWWKSNLDPKSQYSRVLSQRFTGILNFRKMEFNCDKHKNYNFLDCDWFKLTPFSH